MDAQCAPSAPLADLTESPTGGENAQADLDKAQSGSAVHLLPPLSSLSTNESLDLQRAYSCRICFDAFTKETRYPVSLNCGHSFCVICIKKMNRKKSSIMCGVCRKHTFSSHKRLGKNFLLIDILEKNGLLGVEEEKKAKTKSKVQKILNCAENGDWSDAEDTDSTFEEDESQYWGAAYPNDFNSFSIAVDEIEEFHDQLENIQDLLYGFERGVPRNDDFDRQLEELRSEMGRVEQRMRNDRASFRNIAAKSRQLYQLVRQTGTAAAAQVQQSTTNNQQQQQEAVVTNPSSSSSNLRTWLGNHFIGSFSGANTASQAIRLSTDTNTLSWPNLRHRYVGEFDDGEEDEDHFSVPSEDDWNTSGDETEEGFASSRIARENRVVVFLSSNFIRVLSRSADNTQINQVECYLCNVVIQYSYQNAMQHINGRRHRDYIRANQASPSEITAAEGGHSGSSGGSIQPAQVSTRSRDIAWELDEEDEDSSQRQRDIILQALQNGNAFELATPVVNDWRATDNSEASRTSRDASSNHPQNNQSEATPRPYAARPVFSGFGSNLANHTGFINNSMPNLRGGFRSIARCAPTVHALHHTRPGHGSTFGSVLDDDRLVVEEEEGENDDWDEPSTNNWTPFVPQPVPGRAATAIAPNASESRAGGEARDSSPGNARGTAARLGTIRRTPGFGNSSTDNSTTSQGVIIISGRFGNHTARNVPQQQEHNRIVTDAGNDFSSVIPSNANQLEKKEDKPESSRPLTLIQTHNDWGEFSDWESSPGRTRRRSKNNSSTNGNRRGRQSDGQRNQNNWRNSGRANNQATNYSSSLNTAIARNLANIRSSSTWSDNDNEDQHHHHPSPPINTSNNVNRDPSSSTTNGRQQVSFGGRNCNSNSGNSQYPRGSARTDGSAALGGRFGGNGRRGNNQQHRGGRQSGGGRFSSNDHN